MDETKNVSPEELAAEQEALQENKEDEIRASIITEYGFDEVDDVDRIEKLVAKEMEHSKKLSSAIGQKIKWRTEATKPKETTPPQGKKDNVVLDPETIKRTVNETLELRDLESLEYPKELKAEIQKISTTLGISTKQALKDPYIVFKISEYEKENKMDEASISRTNKSGTKGSSFDNPPDVDMSTEEGRKKWEEWKKDQIKKGN